ncbi:Bro-N domain-containing protein [Nitrospirillum sp. BR 11163]|uniref:BRO-N domain-containing protein n=1 Tax=Nitrospirillum sp. BR 11163 TaxID=3104323 RepID=UPI002AFF015C|nr:Bro-N domain-containing protein [Nitrospirillum sp. BR 11163]MEA1674104.1 Bro-N domain-containing protein [Nitrospirillum sp. BR 11163]
MSTVIPFTFEGANVRVLDRNGAPWWYLNEVCGVLEIGNPRDAAGRLDADEKGVGNADTLGGVQAATIINESGLYSLILTSRKPAAKRFKKWVTAEVLPALRRTGRYEMEAPREPPRVILTDADYRKLLAVREVRCTFGPQAAQQFWRDLGLPEVRLPVSLPPQPGPAALGRAHHYRHLAAQGLSPDAIASATGVTARSGSVRPAHVGTFD